MIFANESDINRCKIIVEELLKKAGVAINSKLLESVTMDIMNISYSKGGDYSDEIIKSFAEVYISREKYKKFEK